MPRIVQIIPDFEFGGNQRAGCVLAHAMAARRHAACVVGAGRASRPRAEARP